ncbi:MAG: hypothetical protein ABSH06_32335 [Thermodesulfobacteriota bacterium]
MKKSVLTILLLIPLTLLISAIGFAGEPPPQNSSLVPPAYMGTLTVEWQSAGTTCASNFWPGGPYTCGDVIIHGRLNCAEKGCKDIIIPKKNPIPFPLPLAQVDFLSLEAADLPLRTTYYAWGLSLAGPGTYFAFISANDLNYQSATLFTVDVVVMQFK